MRLILALFFCLWASLAGAQDVNNPQTDASKLTTGTLPAGRMPALTGNCTTSAGAVATSCNVTSITINTSRDLTTATGTQALTGFGFQPTACDGFGSTGGAASIYTTYNGHSDSAKTQATVFSNAGTINFNSSNFFGAVDATGANFQFAAISSYDAGGVTISWTKSGSPTGTFSFSLRCFK